MHIVLWDTSCNAVQKDFAGGMGVGMYNSDRSIRSRLISMAFRRDRRPVAMNFAYMVGIFKRLGHTVQYVVDRDPPAADLYVFNPALVSLQIERDMIRRVQQRFPSAQILVTGPPAYVLPASFEDLNVKVVRGEPEQLLWKLDETLQSEERVVNVGSVKDLDALPWPDWSPFAWRRFRIKSDFWRFPTAYIQQSRGCTFGCDYCPYILVERKTRFREPESIVDEMWYGINRHGFRSFKFRDPLFGLDRGRALRLAERIRSLPKRIQFSVESRIDLMGADTLRDLKTAGLTSITVGVETPDEGTLRRHRRIPINSDRQIEFVRKCRELGIRTIVQFLIGFPEDTRHSIRRVLHYARQMNPTFANFNVVTPYPGTRFRQQVESQIGDYPYTDYNSYTPVLNYQHLTREQVVELHAQCFEKYYFRSRYIKDNAHLLWPKLQMLGAGLRDDSRPTQAVGHQIEWTDESRVRRAA